MYDENAYMEYVEHDVGDNWINAGAETTFRDCGNFERSRSRKTTTDHHIRFTVIAILCHHVDLIITRPGGEEGGDGERRDKRTS